jgi:acyl-CoA synthetase (NDP forming)
MFLPPLATRPEDVARSVSAAADEVASLGKPILGVFMLSGGLPDLKSSDGRRIPAYRTPEPAAIALAHAAKYAEWARTTP